MTDQPARGAVLVENKPIQKVRIWEKILKLNLTFFVDFIGDSSKMVKTEGGEQPTETTAAAK